MTNDRAKKIEQQIGDAISALGSDDAQEQNNAVEQLIRLGKAAVPELLNTLRKPKTNHAQVMYALSTIGDSHASKAFKDGLSDPDEQTRAYAAVGLARINDPDALSACVKTIDDGADMLHLDVTPAAAALADMGLEAVPPLLNLMSAEDAMTRLHAQRALELLIDKRHGFNPGRGFPSPEAQRAARDEWQVNGNYDYHLDEKSRNTAITKWRQWLGSAGE